MLEKAMDHESSVTVRTGKRIDAADDRMASRKSRQGALPPFAVARVQAFVTENLASPLHISELAGSVHLSPFHFARAFKGATGETPHGFVTRMRMEQAQLLLRDGAQPLREIAFAIGYRTQAHFSGVFRTHAGMTPGAFRRKWRDAEDAQSGSAVALATAIR
jgi:AraC family transcriptional regulator